MGMITVMGGGTEARANDFHHVHVTASNASEAVEWYARHLPCEPLSDRDDSVDCGGTEVVFDSQPTRGSSQRTGIDHLAFSYADLDAKMAEVESFGVGGAHRARFVAIRVHRRRPRDLESTLDWDVRL